MVLFVVLARGQRARRGARRKQIKRRIREDCSPRHVPNEVRQIAEVPRTLSGKVLEVPVKRILMGAAVEQAASVDSLANPRSLDYFVELAGELDELGGRRSSGRALTPASARVLAVARLSVTSSCPRVATSYSPSERPMISFMISLVPP